MKVMNFLISLINLLGGKPCLVSFYFLLKMKTRRPCDDRDRRDRIELRTNHWSAQLPRLVEAYLEFRSRHSSNDFPTLDGNEQTTTPLNAIHDIELVDLFCKSIHWSASILTTLLTHL